MSDLSLHVNREFVFLFCGAFLFWFLVNPVITTAPPSFIAVTKLHDTVKMLCAARGSPVPTLEWRKDGVVISTNTTSTTVEEVNGELVIPRFGPTDQGVYTCFFKNYDNGTAETAATAGKTVIIKNIKCKLRNGGVST